ncbi:MAG: hypothetical protein ACO3UX_02350, partial [Candidatus Nanopelagicales bacterium]
MSIVEQLQTSATNVEEVRDGLGLLEGPPKPTEAVLTVADDVLGRADDVLVGAADALESSKRWAPRAAVVLGVVAVATIGVVVVMRLRRRSQDD